MECEVASAIVKPLPQHKTEPARPIVMYFATRSIHSYFFLLVPENKELYLGDSIYRKTVVVTTMSNS